MYQSRMRTIQVMYQSRMRTIQAAANESHDLFWEEAMRVGRSFDGFLMYFMGGEI